MTDSIISVYWSPHHTRYNDQDPNSDTAYFARLQPAWIRIHQPTAAAIFHAQRVAPRAKIMLRSWDIDDHNGDRKSEMYADPIGAANKHRLMWHDLRARLIDELHRNGQGYDISKWHYGLVNEPDPAHMDALVAYTEEAMRRGPELNMRFGVGVASVGTFAKPSESPHGWAKFAKLERAIRDGGHILIIHEYWQPEGPTCVWTDKEGKRRHDAGNLAWRHRDVPMDVPILIGEAGANGYIFNRHSDRDDAGWGRFMNAEQYAAQVHEYVRGCDSRVEGVCLYMTDHHSEQWQSFDTHAAHGALLAIRDVRPERRYTAHVPIVVASPAPEPPKLSVGDGLLSDKTIYLSISPIPPLVGEAIMAVESGGRSHGPDGDLLIRFEAHIFKAQLGNDALWGRYFRHGARPWEGQEWRAHEGEAWRTLHTGNQRDEWAAYDFARALSPEAATRSISMGAPQIMGFNHARIGYPSAEAMRRAFERSAAVQALGFVNFVLGDSALVAAVQARDWRSIARIYNGPGNVDAAAAKYKAAYERLVG